MNEPGLLSNNKSGNAKDIYIDILFWRSNSQIININKWWSNVNLITDVMLDNVPMLSI